MRRENFVEAKVEAGSAVLDEVLGVGESEVQPRGTYSKTRVWIRSLSQNANVKQLLGLIHFVRFRSGVQRRWFSHGLHVLSSPACLPFCFISNPGRVLIVHTLTFDL